MLRKLRIAFLLHNSSENTLDICSDQNLYLMDTTFYQFGVLYLRWKTKKGSIIEAVKEQVDFFGKEVFEANYEREIEELDISPDGVTFNPEWVPTQEELEESIQRTYSWMRDMEIM